MDPATLALMIPITAIVGGSITGVIKLFLAHRERALQIQLQLRQTGNSGLEAQFAALKDDMARLRDTCTSYDLSIDSQLRRIEQRLEFVEGRQIRPTSQEPVEQNVQRVGR